MIVLLYKVKGENDNYINYKGISLPSVSGKCGEIERVRRTTDKLIVEEQWSFRTGRGCVGQVFVLREVFAKARKRWCKVYAAF